MFPQFYDYRWLTYNSRKKKAKASWRYSCPLRAKGGNGHILLTSWVVLIFPLESYIHDFLWMLASCLLFLDVTAASFFLGSFTPVID